MSYRKAKSAPKMFISDTEVLQKKVIDTMHKISAIVGSSMGPGGKVTLIESDLPGIPNKLTKDGVTIFKSLGSSDAFEHLIIESARDAAQRTAAEAGDGTSSSSVLSYNIIKNLFDFCKKNPKYSPQKAARKISKAVDSVLVPYVEERAIKIDESNKDLLKMVATISANGDSEMADAVIRAFEEIGYGDASHVTIREVSGKKGYKVERIDGFPIPVGLEESVGKMSTAFINDQANQRCLLDNPLFLIYDGIVNDMVNILPMINALGEKYVTEGSSDYKNLVIFANGFSDNVVTALGYNFADPGTINVVPIVAPMVQFVNAQSHFLTDLAAFTGAKVFGMRNQLATATLNDLGKGMESFESYRFRSTVIGDPDPVNVEVRADDLKVMMENAESQAEKTWFQERLGKITNGIAKLTISGGSSGEIKERYDRVEDAVCAVRSAIGHGALPGGCRVTIDMALKIAEEYAEGDPVRDVLVPSLMALPTKLLDNAGHSNEEIQEVILKLINEKDLVYDIENDKFGKAEDLGLFDATKAVSESLINAVSIATTLGTCGGLVCHPRDAEFERAEARADSEWSRTVENPHSFTNEANERP